MLTQDEVVFRKTQLDSLGFAKYLNYLQSERWQTFRRWYLSRFIYRSCAACGSPNADLHHKTYRRLGVELSSDMVLLCQPCHKEVHLRSVAMGVGNLRSATDLYINEYHDRKRKHVVPRPVHHRTILGEARAGRLPPRRIPPPLGDGPFDPKDRPWLLSNQRKLGIELPGPRTARRSR